MSFRFLTAIPLLLIAAGVTQAQIPVWKSQYSPSGYVTEGAKVALSPDSAVVVAANYTDDVGSSSLALLKLSRSTGDTLWVRQWLGDSTGGSTGVWAMAVDDSGNVFAACSTGTGYAFDWLTLKYLPDGTLAWSARYDNGGFDKPLCILADRRGGVYVAGGSNSPTGWIDAVAIHYDALGDSMWSFRLDGPGHGKDHFWALAPGPDGSVYAAGDVYTDDIQAADWLTVRFDSLGDTLWSRTYDGGGPGSGSLRKDVARCIAVDDSGNCYVVGEAYEPTTWEDAVTVKYAPDGTRRWVYAFDWGNGGIEVGTYVGLDAGRHVYVGGVADDGDGSDMLVYRLSQESIPVVDWQRRVDNGVYDDDSLSAMAVDARGNSYITGWVNTSNLDLAWRTTKFGPSGDTIWWIDDGLFDTDNQPFDLKLDELGDVYVTGYETPTSSSPERATTFRYTQYDVGVDSVVFSQDTFRIGATVTPRALVRNHGAVTERDFPVRMDIGNLYTDAVNVESIPPNGSLLVRFTPWVVEERALGSHPVTCYTMLDVDKDATNDTAHAQVTAVTVWEPLASIPLGPKSAGVKDGGALAFVPDSLVFAFKGNNTAEFYAFNTRTRAWVTKDSIPPIGTSGRKKRVKSGGRLAADTLGHVFATKGNNSVEFWRYTVPSDSWKQLADVPYGGLNKKVKAGTGLAYVPRKNGLYLVKGNNTLEFYVFDVASGVWQPRSSVPVGTANKKVKDGSVMAYDGNNTIYFLKGNTYEFWSYNVLTDTWQRRRDLRNSYLSTKKRKMKKGAGMAFDTEYNRVYVTKGYKLNEFWYYDVGRDSWVETPDVFPVPPGGKPPYAGSDLCYGAGKIYALNGNKTNLFYRYNANFPYNPLKDDGGQQANDLVSYKLNFTIAPNPFLAHTALRYTLPQAGRVRLVLYDVTGRVARTVVNDWQARGEHVANLRSDGLAAGVYIAKLWIRTEAASLVTTRKVTIAR